MFGKRRTNQGGSIATFVVVGIILATVLIGGIYVVNFRSQQARDNQEIATSDTEKTGSSDDESKQPSVSAPTEQPDDKSAPVVDSNASTEDDPSQDLPATGLEIGIGQILGAYLLTVSSVAYILSRRESRRSL